MEKYRLFLTDTTRMPNVERRITEYGGLQDLSITRKFSFDVPIGWSVSASEETLQVFNDDALWLYEMFCIPRGGGHGLNLVVPVRIERLNSLATQYITIFTGQINVETLSFSNSIAEFTLVDNSFVKEWKDKSNCEMKLVSQADTIHFNRQMQLLNEIKAVGFGQFAQVN